MRRASNGRPVQSSGLPQREDRAIATTRRAAPRGARTRANGSTPGVAAHDGTRARPFVKWAGGKTQIVEELVARAPEHIDTYYEPFVGGGALFFRLAADPQRRPRRAVINDRNARLIATYEAVRDDVEGLIRRLARLDRDYRAGDEEARADYYYRVREREPRDPLGEAARLIFLNKTCFNGLYRVNRAGQFNVPHGRYRSPRILDREGLRAASAALAGVELRDADFEEACAEAGAGDFVYFDPPFEPLSATSSFTAYTETSFGRDDQLRLLRCINGLRDRGADMMLSNSAHEWIVGLYEGHDYRLERLPARRAINSNGSGRGAIDELLATSYEVTPAG